MRPAPLVIGRRYGAAIAGGYVQRSHWMDLLVGAPFASAGSNVDGLAQLSKATESSACTEITATREATDSEGDPVLMQVFQVDGAAAEVHVLLLEPYNMGAFEDFGGAGERLCTTTVSGPVTDASFSRPRGLLAPSSTPKQKQGGLLGTSSTPKQEPGGLLGTPSTPKQGPAPR